jgi:hypothetical protein
MSNIIRLQLDSLVATYMIFYSECCVNKDNQIYFVKYKLTFQRFEKKV